MASIRADEFTTREQLRDFGLTMALILSIIALVTVTNQNNLSPVWLLLVMFFGLMGILAPSFLRPIEKAWIKLGIMMGMVVTPIVMGILFFGLITPIGIILRIMGKDILNQTIQKDAKSYWIKSDKIEDHSRYFTPY